MRVYRALSPNEQAKFVTCVDQYNPPTQQQTDRRKKVLMLKVFYDVYQNRLAKGRSRNFGSFYNISGMELLRYQRNFVMHGVDHLKVCCSSFLT
jgi:hypothetical protein